MQTLADHATIWFNHDIPTRLVWRGRRWTVTDTPTPLYATHDIPALITHPPTLRVGWRFQATDDGGDTLVVDVLREGDGWIVARTYE